MQARQDPLEDLRERIRSNLDPVRPLRSERLCLQLAAAFLMTAFVALWAALGLRADGENLGDFWLWGPSVFQITMALVALGLAMFESLPGRSPSTWWLGLAAASGVACHLVTSVVLAARNPQGAPEHIGFAAGARDFCFELSLGLPVVFVAMWIAQRGFTARTTRVGLLIGLGAALACDGVWRLFCPATELSHVLLFHSSALVVILLAAWTLAERWKRLLLSGRAGGASVLPA